MSAFAIQVNDLGKRYRLNHQIRTGNHKYTALRDVLASSITRPFRFLSQRRSQSMGHGGVNGKHEDFWALQDVSFEIMPGESVGIVGRNGAGKSTLLKILSRITEPTTGRVDIEGRVSSLLEVGTGFHPELTGRENIFLNGTILGMKRTEIKKRFDEIVSFADVERFLDTPVKHFSSGMYVRLAFAIAAHLESEILIVDEVLAVGDSQFQKKCLSKMEDITEKGGRTLLFVSHNMDLVSKLCSKALLLTAGKAGKLEPVESAVSKYLSLAEESFVADRPRVLQTVTIDREALAKEKVMVIIGFRLTEKVNDLGFGLILYTEGGTPITASNTTYHPTAKPLGSIVEGEITLTFEQFPLWSGRYSVSVWITNGLVRLDHQEAALVFDYVSTSTPLNAPPTKWIGPLYLPARWQLIG